jgi:AbrB family looped-hinge helix DNA binding protein
MPNMESKDSMEKITTLDELWRLLIPKELREGINWKEGDKIAISLNSEDSLLLRRVD